MKFIFNEFSNNAQNSYLMVRTYFHIRCAAVIFKGQFLIKDLILNGK